MSDSATLALDFVKNFTKLLRSFRMYSPTHPQVQVDMKEAWGWLQKMLAAESPTVLGSRDGVMIVQGRPVREMTASMKAFCDLLSARGIASFSVHTGATMEEFSALVEILVKRPEDVMKGDSIKPELLQPLHHFRLNELRFVALEDGVSEEAVSALSSGGAAQQAELMSLISAFVSGKEVNVGGTRALTDRLTPLIKSGNADEFVGLMDGLSAQLEAAGVPPEERSARMSQLFKLLPIAEEVQKLRKVIVVQEDTSLLEEWSEALRKGGFEVESMPAIEPAMALARDGTHWSGLVADAGFRGLAGIKFLDELGTRRKPLPVVLLSWDEAIPETKAVKTYPKLRYIAQPAEAPAILAALEEIALPPAITRPSKEQMSADPKLAREMERAHEIQSKLLPTTMPKIPGHEVAAAYEPAGIVGGDYYDVLQLPNDCAGLLVADVSGKGISAAMIMVMARTVFHAIAPDAATPKEAVLKAADRIAADLPAGVFLTLLYAVLNPHTHTVSIVNAGHLQPMLWTKMDGMTLVETIDVSGAAIGLVRGPAFERSLHTCDIQLQPGEQLVLLTDGVTEAMDAYEEEFGDKKVYKAIKMNGSQSASKLALGIIGAVGEHRGAAESSDDLTVLVIRRTP